MARPRLRESHLMPLLYVTRGRRKDTYWTKLNGKYYGLGGERASAERALEALLQGQPLSCTIAGLAARFIRSMNAELERGDRDALAPRTISDHTQALKRHLVPVFGNMTVTEFMPTHAAQYLARMKEKKRAVRANREIAALASMFSYGMSIGVVSANPCHGVRRNREFPRSRRPTIAEMNALLDLARTRGSGSYMVALIGTMVAVTGRRRAEIMRLTQAAETPEGLSGIEVKARRGRLARSFLVEWTPFLRDLIAEARCARGKTDSMYLFPSRHGRPYADSGFKAIWNRLMNEYVAGGGERFTAHDLRALFVSEKLDRGEDPKTHRDPRTTLRVYRRGPVTIEPLA